MAPKTEKPNKSGLTGREQDLANMAWQCIEGDWKVDVNKFAQLANIQANTARSTWSRLKTKLASLPVDGGEEKTSTENADGGNAVPATANDDPKESTGDAPKPKRKRKATEEKK